MNTNALFFAALLTFALCTNVEGRFFSFLKEDDEPEPSLSPVKTPVNSYSPIPKKPAAVESEPSPSVAEPEGKTVVIEEPKDDPEPEPEYPFACNITRKEDNSFVCGGILVHRKWVVTPAHCVEEFDEESYGKLKVFCNNSQFKSKVDDIVIHEKWLDIDRLPYDIALVKLVKTANRLPVASYLDSNASLSEGELYAVEWEQEDKESDYDFHGAKPVDYVDSELCNSKLHWTLSVEESQFCALHQGFSECTSDKGTAVFHLPPPPPPPSNKTTTVEPYSGKRTKRVEAKASAEATAEGESDSKVVVVVETDDEATEEEEEEVEVDVEPTLTLVGLSSFDTKECNRHGFPIVYTSVAAHIEWMDDVIYGMKKGVSKEKQEELDAEHDALLDEEFSDMNSTELVAAAINAILYDNSTTLEYLLSIGLKPDAFVDDHKRTLLHLAANYDAYHSAQVLVQAGADVSKKEKSLGATPLHFAAVSGSIPVADVLLKAGAYANEPDKEESTPLHYLVSSENTTLIMLMFLLEGGANVHVVDKYHATPLHYAARENWASATKVLIQAGANLIVYAKDDGTPHHWAGRYGSDDALKVLLEAGANVEAKPRTGLRETGIGFAVRNGAGASTVQVFIDYGANTNVRDRDGYAPLHRAAQLGAVDVIKVLLKNNANKTIKNSYGNTPVVVFCNNFNCELKKNQETYRLLKD